MTAVYGSPANASIAGETRQQIRLVRRSEPATVTAFRHHAAAFAAEHGAGAELTTDVALAVSEAVTNAVKHAQANPECNVELSAAAEGSWLEIRISDQGERPGEDPSGGLGLHLIANACDDLEIVQEGAGTQVRMLFAVY